MARHIPRLLGEKASSVALNRKGKSLLSCAIPGSPLTSRLELHNSPSHVLTCPCLACVTRPGPCGNVPIPLFYLSLHAWALLPGRKKPGISEMLRAQDKLPGPSQDLGQPLQVPQQELNQPWRKIGGSGSFVLLTMDFPSL